MDHLKILIPTDFSVQADFAYLMVKKLGEQLENEIHFLHVLHVPDTVSMNAKGEIETCGDIDVNYIIKQKEIADRKLQALRDTYGNDIQTHLVLGKLTDSILEYATTNQFDLIVMGTKGAWGVKEKVSGTETQAIARRSNIPLLSLMCDRSDLVVKNLLLVHPFDQKMSTLPNIIKKLAIAFDATLNMLHIHSGVLDSNKEATIKQSMVEFAQEQGFTKYACYQVTDTDIESGVVHFNQMNQMDIVCIGTVGKGGFFHNNSTDKLINHLFKPIISFQLHS